MPDLLLVNPPFGHPYGTDIKQGVRLDNRPRQPLDLAYTASVLLENDFSVDLLDANILKMSYDDVISRMRAPGTVLITTSPMDRWECPYLDIDAPARLAREVKKQFPETTVMFTGAHGTTTPDWVFKNCSDVDIVIKGEPEYTTLELMQHIARGERSLEEIQGISFRKNGAVAHNVPRPLIQDLDALPLPAYHLMPMDRYLAHGSHFNRPGLVPHSVMVSTRGCPHSCTYCLRGMWGRQFRKRAPAKIVDEMELLTRDYGITNFYFIDLEFCLVKTRVHEVCDEIITRGIDVRWGCCGRLDSVDEAAVLKMKQAGCTHINCGVESGSARVLAEVKKGITVEKASASLRMMQENGMHFNAFMMSALPGEDEQSLKETAEFAAAHGIVFLGGNMPIPYPGTELYEMAKQQYGEENVRWDTVGTLAGRVGTSVLDRNAEGRLTNSIRVLYVKQKYGKYYFANPRFWNYVARVARSSKRQQILNHFRNYLDRPRTIAVKAE